LKPGSRLYWAYASDHMSGILPVSWHVIDQCRYCRATRLRELEPRETAGVAGLRGRPDPTTQAQWKQRKVRVR
jgi:hypothetical protein